MAADRVEVQVDAIGLDETIEKAKRLVELLQQASNIIRSLSGVDLES